MRVSELKNTYLDYWVLRAKGAPHSVADFLVPTHSHSTFWFLGGPLIESSEIHLMTDIRATKGPKNHWHRTRVWVALDKEEIVEHTGPTALIAAMRVFVALTYGENVPAEGEL